MITDINSEDRLVQETLADHLHDVLGWDNVYAWNEETFGPAGTLGRDNERDTVLVRDLRDAIQRLNELPTVAVDEAVQKLTHHDYARSMVQHNREFYAWLRDGVPVSYRDDAGQQQDTRARVIDFRTPSNNRFLVVRELKIQGLKVPHYNRRADLICFVNGLPLVFFELKAVYRNIRAAYDGKRWQSGKSMLVCIDKITCGRMHQLIMPRWTAKIERLREVERATAAAFTAATDPDDRERLDEELDLLHQQIAWMKETIIEIIISEGQNEVRDFKRWGFDIKPHRYRMQTGFETPDGKRIDVETAFKDPAHPFRVAIVCAMWLTGFDVECLSTMYIDKPMKAHTLMQAIARANRVYPGKACGVIVDYNGMLKSLREALAQYALSDEEDKRGGGGGGGGGGGIVDPIEKQLKALVQAIEATEKHLVDLKFDPRRLVGAKGFDRIEALADAVDAVSNSDESRRRFEILARQVFACFKALITEPSAEAYAERHDNVEAIYKKLEEKRDNADVTEVLKALHRIVNEAIATQGRGSDRATGLTVDLSRIDFRKLRDEFEKKVRRKRTALCDIAALVEAKLAAMLARSPRMMDYYKKYQEIVADYNREKDRATVEDTFAKLIDLAKSLDAEQRRAVEEGLTDDELALFDLLQADKITKADREKVKQASRDLLAKLQSVLRTMEHWTLNAQTQAEVETLILDHLYVTLPRPPFREDDAKQMAARVYDYVWQRSAAGVGFSARAS